MAKVKAKNKQTPGEAKQLILKRNLGIFVFAFAFVLYLNTLHHGYVFDDFSTIKENAVTTQGIKAIPDIFSHFYRYGYYSSDDGLYRPLAVTVFAIEWWLSPDNPALAHFVNILLYAVTGLVLFRFLCRFFKGQNIILPFIVSLLFISHPIHTEVVANIKSLDEILGFLLSLLSLTYLYRYAERKSNRDLGTGALLFFLALLCKESAITMVAAFPVLLFFSFPEKRKEITLASLSAVCAAGIFLVIRAWVLSKSAHSEYGIALLNPLLLAKDPLQRFSNELRILGYYLRLLIYPRPLVYDYSYNQMPLANSFDVLSIVSGLIYLSALVFGVIGLIRKQLLAAGILFYLITISVFSNIFLLVSVNMAERFAYIPSLGFCMVLALLLARWTKAKLAPTGTIDFPVNKRLLFTAGFLIVAYSFMTISRNRDWKDNITLFSHDIEYQQENARAHCFLGNELLKIAESEQDKSRFINLNLQGIAELKKSLAIYPENEDALSSIGNGYLQVDSFDVAEKYFKEANKLNPATGSNLAYLYLKRGDFKNAISLSEKILKQDPKNVDVLICAGIAYGSVKKYDDAIRTLSSAAQIQPSSAKIYYYLSTAYKFKGDSVNYRKYAQEASRLDPSFR